MLNKKKDLYIDINTKNILNRNNLKYIERRFLYLLLNVLYSLHIY